LLRVKQGANRLVTIEELKYTIKNGAAFKNVSYDFGDGTSPTLTDKTSGINHTYARDGEYTIKATVSFTVGNEVKTAVCTAKVNYQGGTPVTPATPTQLVNTGAGEVFGLFAVVTAAGAVAHRIVLARRLS
jgi:hypothetical protein